ncbi:MAG: HNH endonuclease [Actinomycetia bacterium]|nr:HNH endonuclease [Actinomycetes bacterium]
MTAVPVLNHSEIVLSRVSLKHAIRMLVRKVVVPVEEDPNEMVGPFPRPIVVRLVRDVFAKFLYQPAFCTKKGVLRRDRNRCAYCGGHASTVDHIVPASRGGTNSWLNLVSACQRCNGAKADRTPDEARMPLRFAAWEPRRIDIYS